MEPAHGHLNKVAFWAGKFAAEMFLPGSKEAEQARQWGCLAGLWHDLGKFSEEFQDYLRKAGDPHAGETTGRVDHSTAGARHAHRQIPVLGTLLSFLIAGHHSGLGNGIDSTDSCLEKRLAKTIPNPFAPAPAEILEFAASLNLPPVLATSDSPGQSLAYLGRILFSALVDADFLATEAFMSAERSKERPVDGPSPAALEEALDTHVAALVRNAPATSVNRSRGEILAHCRSSAEQAPGLFSLTVPTGGGKTLSSLAFALKHARIHGLRRVVYVIPFTSIIEQNAAVFREVLAALGPDVVIEHHSNLDPDSAHASTTARLATENWDATLIVTTNVQFLESLHANRTSHCRKLHRLARSVVILDEAQSLPLEFLNPCLRALEELTTRYGSTVVLCTATQPAIHWREDFPIGLAAVREIVPDPPFLYRQLRRVDAERLTGKTSDETLSDRLSERHQVLAIVNTRRHARKLFELLPNDGTRFHLSALMCPEHRSEVLRTIRERLEQGAPVRLVSTQLIEAGVDIDFPVVYRAVAGLDAIAQAAGRCDREGRRTAEAGRPGGRLFIFEPESENPPPYIRSCANSTSQVFGTNPPDLLGLDAIHDYFQRHYWDNRDATDQKHILDCFPLRLEDPSDLLCIAYKQCAEDFRLIDDYSEPVLIQYGEKGRALCDELRAAFGPAEIRRIARRLQRFTVTIPKPQHARLVQAGVLLRLHEGRFFVLNSTLHYSATYGLHPEPDLNLPPCESII